jgi:hypothetical protein
MRPVSSLMAPNPVVYRRRLSSSHRTQVVKHAVELNCLSIAAERGVLSTASTDWFSDSTAEAAVFKLFDRLTQYDLEFSC